MALSRRRAWDEQYAGRLAEARWAHDSLVPSVADRTLPAVQVQQAWPDGKRRLDDLQAGLYQMGTKVPDDVRAARLNRLAAAVAAVQTALASDVALRSAAAPADPAALATSAQQVQAARGDLLGAIEDTPQGPPSPR